MITKQQVTISHIKKANGLLKILETVQQYPASHAPLIAHAQEELNNDVRPELITRIENFDQYDIIFIGYPNWWGNLPAPLYTFLESYDFAGKVLVPFNSHG